MQIIAWFAENKVAANLLMLILIVGGLVTVTQIKLEVFPEFPTDLITVTVPYLGAAPEEVEEGVCVRIEEQLQGIVGIKRISSKAAEGLATVTVELLTEADAAEVLDEVKARVDAIDTFPEDIESPVVQELKVRRHVITVAISGDTDERSLKVLAERIRDGILAIPDITQAEIKNARPYEISIEVSEKSLRRHGLTFDDVAAAVRRSSVDLPGGSIRTHSGEFLLRAKGQGYTGADFEKLPLMSGLDGTRIAVGAVARVRDTFAETDQSTRFDGAPGLLIQVFRVGDQNALQIAEQVKRFVSNARGQVPEGIQLTTWSDNARVLRSRLNLLLRNGRTGFIIVVLILTLFLRAKLSFWVSLGIPISFLGTLWMMPALDASINLMTLFAFLVVLGIVVDDAIVVGENIYAHFEAGKTRLEAAVAGVQEMAVPVTFAVVTSVAAFAPLLMIPGLTGRYFEMIPAIVIPTLLFSLVESLLILPAHLSSLEPRRTPRGRITGTLRALRTKFDDVILWIIRRVYAPMLNKTLQWRYVTVAVAVSCLLITAATAGAGWIQFVFFPDVEADNVSAALTMPLGTPVQRTEAVINRLERAALQLRSEIDAGLPPGQSNFRHILVSIGDQPFRAQQAQNAGEVEAAGFSGAHLGEINIELVGSEERNASSSELADRWRDLAGAVPEAVELSFDATLFSIGDPIDVLLSGLDFEQLQMAAEELKGRLAGYSGVYDIADSFRLGKREIKLNIKPQAEILGLKQLDLARQVRQGFYGDEVQRIQRGRDDVKVMVRYPLEERESLETLEQMRIRTAAGEEVPFRTVAEAEFGRGYSVIERVDRRRSINVTAKVDTSITTPTEVTAALENRDLPEILARYSTLSYSVEGQQKEQRDSLLALARGFVLALFLIFALMAVPLRSYSQPLLIMTAIPFGLVGAVWGHAIMGLNLSILSMFGIVALAGVVVNDSLILVDAVNRQRRKQTALLESVVLAGKSRFRPILLTSLTTFGGLTPLILEKSLQAQFLIPMAVSLAFGVLFTTFITLILIPALYLIGEDVQRLLGTARQQPATVSVQGLEQS